MESTKIIFSFNKSLDLYNLLKDPNTEETFRISPHIILEQFDKAKASNVQGSRMITLKRNRRFSPYGNFGPSKFAGFATGSKF